MSFHAVREASDGEGFGFLGLLGLKVLNISGGCGLGFGVQLEFRVLWVFLVFGPFGLLRRIKLSAYGSHCACKLLLTP